MLLKALLRRFIQSGSLRVIWSNGQSTTFDKGIPGPSVALRLHDKQIERRLFLTPELACGEGYMSGQLTLEEGDIYDLLDLFGSNYAQATSFGTVFHDVIEWVDTLFRHFHQFNPLNRSKENVAHHYDLSAELYDLFLDSDRQYSCAYFPKGSEDLETAQEAKKRHIAQKLILRPKQTVLDIGSGWGGMALFLAKNYSAHVTGVTLSREQLSYSGKRVRNAQLEKQVSFLLKDYRELEGHFDRIVSVGMFEHVGARHYGEYFARIKHLLNEDGVAVLHTIGRMGPPATTSPWIRKYIFPGGYSPSLSEITKAIEKSGLLTADVEVLRLHYAKTLRHWRLRFMKNRDKAVELYGERFARMWEYYLAASEVAFLHMGHVVFQLQLTPKQTNVPLTRDYLYQGNAQPVKETLSI